MARKTQTIVTLIDDLDGGDATTTHTLMLDKRLVTIDLSAENSARLTTFLEPFLVAGTPTSLTKLAKTRRTGTTRRSASERAAARAWAIENGLMNAETERVPAHVYEKFDTHATLEENHDNQHHIDDRGEYADRVADQDHNDEGPHSL